MTDSSGALLGWGLVKPRKPKQKSSEVEIAYKPDAVDGIDTRNIVSVSAGSSHALALDEFGQVFAWGRGTEGQLGLGNRATQDAAHKVELGVGDQRITQVSSSVQCTVETVCDSLTLQ